MEKQIKELADTLEPHMNKHIGAKIMHEGLMNLLKQIQDNRVKKVKN